MTRQIAIFAGGCFWCTEAVFQDLKGVHSVISGYIGGKTENPTYREICTGTTGHAEAIKIEFDPEIIKYEELLEIFWTTHDPTTLNRQGNDVGTQYRSAIFYIDEDQKEKAMVSSKTKGKEIWDDTIVTEISEATTFYPAEKYHQNYYKNNANQGYCRIIISPKVAKVRKQFAQKLKNA